MKIIHIKGTMCSGKTHIITPFLDREDVKFWDVLDFYNEHKCIKEDGLIDWDKWRKYSPNIPKVLETFLDECKEKDKIAIIESGTNLKINELLHCWWMQGNEITTIELKVPENDILITRANLRNVDVNKVLEFKHTYLKRHAIQQQFALSQEEASLVLKAKLDGQINIGIIGTAGRKEDGTKMSKELYMKMYRYALSYLNKLSLTPKEIQLVSGGAAWADHLAISLFLADKAIQLRLHLPARLSEILNPIKGTMADAAAYYHIKFSKEMGGYTIDGIHKAIDKGAEVIVTEGFKPRDLKIAKDSEILLAFTWGEGKEPKKGSGTAYTWNNSNATVKVHIPLKEL